MITQQRLAMEEAGVSQKRRIRKIKHNFFLLLPNILLQTKYNVSLLLPAGGWSSWGAWTKCTIISGTAMHERTRHCNNPPRGSRGQCCAGLAIQSANCSIDLCDGMKCCYVKIISSSFNLHLTENNISVLLLILERQTLSNYVWNVAQL